MSCGREFCFEYYCDLPAKILIGHTISIGSNNICMKGSVEMMCKCNDIDNRIRNRIRKKYY